MKFIDFFSGIGGFRLGMEMAGHECVGHCEIDKFADKSYRAMHNIKECEWYASDITTVKSGELPEADCYCFGFPCQAFSIAGKRRGFEDTRGTLFFEIMRLARERKPKLLFAENVAGLLIHDSGRTFGIIISTMDELGYDVEWQVLNSKNFRVPQNRERVFIIGHLRGAGGRKVFPVRESTSENHTKQIAQIFGTDKEPNPSGGRVYNIDDISPATGAGHSMPQPYIGFIGMNPRGVITDTARTIQARYHKGYSNHRGANSGVAIPVLTPDRGKKRQNGRRFKENGEPMFTLTAQDRHGVIISGLYTNARKNFQRPPLKELSRTLKANKPDAGITDGTRIRRLTPKECFRLQGFPDEYFDRAAKVNSETQLYKQAGNSVTVNVIYEIARRFEPWEGEK